MWKFLLVGVSGVVAAPIAWTFLLHDYQKQRILTFLHPDSDPLGAGYNIIQANIAAGSGGWFGKGLLQGSQSQLSFLPEKQTDFIFTMLAEEFGFAGGILVLALFTLVLFYAISIALTCRNQFGRLLAVGVGGFLFFHLFINIGMATGMMPVVGVPLPFLSYGGTILVTSLAGVGILLNVQQNRMVSLS